jgi:hypothetical protein
MDAESKSQRFSCKAEGDVAFYKNIYAGTAQFFLTLLQVKDLSNCQIS